MPLLPAAEVSASAVHGAALRRPALRQLRTATGAQPDALTAVCFDAWLLCSHGQPGIDGLPDGRQWERAVANVLITTRFEHRQGPGQTTLLGSRTSSGVAHELDGAGRTLGHRDGRGSTTVVLEAKAVTALPKVELASFHSKVWDYYLERLPAAASGSWHPILVSAGNVSEPLRRLCVQRAIVLIDPARVPLPVLLWFTSRPGADMRLPGALLSEAMRLGPRAIATMQDRWPLQPNGTVAFDPSWWSGTALPDLSYVHDELSAAVLDLYDTEAPGRLEQRAAALVAKLRRFD